MDDIDVAAEIARAEELKDTDPRACLALVQQIEGRISREREPALAARLSYLRGRVYFDRGDYYRALAEVRSARRDWLAAGHELEALSTTLGRTTVLLEFGEFEEVVALVEKLFGALGSLSPTPEQERLVTYVHATANNNVGDAYHGLGEEHRAMRHYDVAANLYQALGDTDGIAVVRMNRGVSLLALGMPHRALEELLDAHRIYAEAGFALSAAQCLIPVAEAYQALGHVTRAIRLLRTLRPSLESMEAAPDVARLQLALGSALLQVGLHHDAHLQAREAADAFAGLGMIEKSGRAALLCAQASMASDRLESAVTELAGAERLFAECGASCLQSQVWVAQADLARRLGDTAAATLLAERVLVETEGHDHSDVAALARLLLADLAEDRATAERHLLAVSETAFVLGRRSLRLALGMSRARRHRRSGRLREATEELRRTQRLAHAMEHDNPDAEGRSAVRSRSDQARDELIDALLEHSGRSARIEAWQWARLAKSRVTVTLVEPTVGWVPDQEDEGSVAPRADALRALLEPLDELMPGAVSPARTPFRSPVIELPDVPEGPVLEYYVLGDDLVAFVIREGEVHVRRLRGATVRSRQLVSTWQQECSMLAATRHDRQHDVFAPDGRAAEVLRDLHSVVIAPLADLLDDIEDEPLLVLGHRHLHSVPFEALIDPHGSFLLDRFELRFAFGLAAPEDDESGALGDALVLAVPDDNAPLIRAEATVVAEHLPGAELYVGPAATSEIFLRKSGGRDLVHVACHGVFRPGNPFFSALRLGDRWLAAREIIDADLSGAQVVLSACTSGSVSEQGAEPIGLAWACLAAGARGVIAAMWAVDDAVTYDFMERLYERLGEGQPARRALELARRDIAMKYPHPYHWAPFRHFGSAALS